METKNSVQIVQNVKPGVLYGHVPYHLDIPDRPDLNYFPRDVLFTRFNRENPDRGGKLIVAKAIYKPALASYRKEGFHCFMEYFNIYSPDSWLGIEYNWFETTYSGEKFVEGKSVGWADGKDWRTFFFNFTLLSLFKGEGCEFLEIPDTESN